MQTHFRSGAAIALTVIILGACAQPLANLPTSETQKTPVTASLDLTKLPLGDKKYSTSPRQGYVFACNTNFNGGRAFQQGPWIDATAKTWKLLKKLTVSGAVKWESPSFKATIEGDKRVITSNGLPSHITGVYPVQSSDDAYAYDRNPNSIKSQSFSLSLPTDPTLNATPQCVGGEVGILLTGIPIFNAFDAAGRDAVANEVQDDCDGHPQNTGLYHYHGYSDCSSDKTAANEHSTLAGYAFDGFGIYGLKGEKGVELQTALFDECHGHTHEIMWDGKKQSMYHYHFTKDFPYSVSCFRGTSSVKGPFGGAPEEGGRRRPPPGQN